MTIIPAFPEPSAILFLLALLLFAAGVDLHAVLPHLALGHHGTLAAVALVGGLWMGAFGCGVMGIASALVEVCIRMQKKLAISRKV